MEDSSQRASRRTRVDLVVKADRAKLLAILLQGLGALQDCQVPGDAVVATEVHDAAARDLGRVVELVDHGAHPIRLTRDVAVMRSID